MQYSVSTSLQHTSLKWIQRNAGYGSNSCLFNTWPAHISAHNWPWLSRWYNVWVCDMCMISSRGSQDYKNYSEGVSKLRLLTINGLVPKPLPDCISQSWRTPQLWDSIWEWPENEARISIPENGIICVALHCMCIVSRAACVVNSILIQKCFNYKPHTSHDHKHAI